MGYVVLVLLATVGWLAVAALVWRGKGPGARRTRARVRRWWGRRPWAPPPGPDPFEVLALQLRLERLSGEIARLQEQDQGFARAHHLRAAVSAYDDLLAEACLLAGAPVHEATGPVRRLLEEAELRARGWNW